MRIKCDKCSVSCTASAERLEELGWSRLTITSPSKKTFTRCPMHRAGMTEEIGKAQGLRIGG
ncbi:MAG: hypothetical protein U0R44_03230 [Candidatus Micrarchaeia archaeon]